MSVVRGLVLIVLMGIPLSLPAASSDPSPDPTPVPTREELDEQEVLRISELNHLFAQLVGETRDTSHLIPENGLRRAYRFRVKTTGTGYVLITDPHQLCAFELPSGELWYSLNDQEHKLLNREGEREVKELLSYHLAFGCNPGCIPLNEFGRPRPPEPTPTPVTR